MNELIRLGVGLASTSTGSRRAFAIVFAVILQLLGPLAWAQKPKAPRPANRPKQGGATPSTPGSSLTTLSPSPTSERNTAAALLPIPEPMGESETAMYIQRLTESGPQVRLNVLRALPLIGARAIALGPTLVSLFHDPDWETRIEAMHAMEAIGAPALPYVPAIEAAMGDPSLKLKITGEIARDNIIRLAQSSPPVTATAPQNLIAEMLTNLAKCRAELDSLKRLVCYDAILPGK